MRPHAPCSDRDGRSAPASPSRPNRRRGAPVAKAFGSPGRAWRSGTLALLALSPSAPAPAGWFTPSPIELYHEERFELEAGCHETGLVLDERSRYQIGVALRPATDWHASDSTLVWPVAFSYEFVVRDAEGRTVKRHADDAGLDHAIGVGVPDMLAAPGTLPRDEPLTLAFCAREISEAFLAAYEREVRLTVMQWPFLLFTF